MGSVYYGSGAVTGTLFGCEVHKILGHEEHILNSNITGFSCIRMKEVSSPSPSSPHQSIQNNTGEELPRTKDDSYNF